MHYLLQPACRLRCGTPSITIAGVTHAELCPAGRQPGRCSALPVGSEQSIDRHRPDAPPLGDLHARTLAAANFDEALRGHEALAAKKLLLVSFVQHALDIRVLGLGDLDRDADRNLPRFHGTKKAGFSAGQKPQHSAHIFQREPRLAGDVRIGVPALAHAVDIVEEVKCLVLTSGHVLDQAHHEAILGLRINHHGRDAALAEFSEGFQAALAAYKVIPEARGITPLRDRNGPLEPDCRDAVHDLLEHLAAAGARVDHVDRVDGDELYLRIGGNGHHAASMMSTRRARSARASRLSNRKASRNRSFASPRRSRSGAGPRRGRR